MTTHSPDGEWEVFGDLDPVILASLRSQADEDAIVAALETQLTRQAAIVAALNTQLAVLVAQSRHVAPVIPFRRRAIEQRAA